MKPKLLDLLIEAALSDQAYKVVKENGSVPQYLSVEVVPLTYVREMVGDEKYQQLLNGEIVSAPVKTNNPSASLTGFYSISKDNLKLHLMKYFYSGTNILKHQFCPTRVRDTLIQKWNKVTGDNIDVNNTQPNSNLVDQLQKSVQMRKSSGSL